MIPKGFKYYLMMALMLSFTVGALQAEARVSPMEFLKNETRKIQKILDGKAKKGSLRDRRKRKRLVQEGRKLLNYWELGRKSLGRYWKKRTPAEKKEFVGLLQKLIEKKVLNSVSDQSNFTITYGKAKVKGTRASISTEVLTKKTEVTIEYRLKWNKPRGKWMVVNMITDDMNLVRNYRSQFKKIIKKKGYAKLIKKMKKKLSKL